ncbi:MAG: YafY family protein, partial [Pseudohongiellaceae bacterium]
DPFLVDNRVIPKNGCRFMQRAERLFQITNLLRNRRLAITADQLAASMNTSKRTIYRDIQSLILSGVPIEGEAGVGYRLQRNFDLPPLMFSNNEVEALLLGVRMVRAWSDEKLASGANSALRKILAVVPPKLRDKEEQFAVYVPEFADTGVMAAYSDTIRQALQQRRVLAIEYTRADGRKSERKVHPIGLFFWGRVWTLLTWCESTDDYRSFRLDRINNLEMPGETYALSPTKNLDHYLATVVYKNLKGDRK